MIGLIGTNQFDRTRSVRDPGMRRHIYGAVQPMDYEPRPGLWAWLKGLTR